LGGGGGDGDSLAEGFCEQVCKWNWFTASELNATLGDSFLCVSHRHKHAGGIQTSLLYSRIIPQMFPGSNPNSMITFVLCPIEKYNNVIYAKIFKGFYFFHLVLAMVSTAKSTA